MTRRRFAWLLLALAATAVAGRVAYVLTVTQDQTLFVDEAYYAAGARSLVQGDGFEYVPLIGAPPSENATHPPLTSIVLAPAAWLSDSYGLAMRFTVVLAGAGVVVLTGLIGREVAGPRAGLIAAGIAAAYPYLWANDGLLMSETFATLTTAATVLLAYSVVSRVTWPRVVALGVVSGLAMLSRAELALLVPALVLPVILTLRDLTRARRLAVAGVAVAAAALTISPWVVYNLARFERPVLLSNSDGSVLLGANCDETYYGSLIGSHEGRCGLLAQGEPSVHNEAQRERAREYISDHLGRLPVVVAVRVGRMWSIFKPFQMADFAAGENTPRWVSHAGFAVSLVLIPAAVVGAVALRRRRLRILPLLAPAIVVTVAAAAFYPRSRYRAPAEVGIVVLAAVAFEMLLDRRRSRPQSVATL